MRRESERRWSVWIIALVVLSRAAFVLATRHDPVFRVPYLDGAFYHAWARSLAEGHGDFHGPYFLGPLYPWFLSILYRLVGAQPMAVRVVQSALGVLDVVLVMSLARKLYGAAAGRLAAALVALYGPLVFYESLLVMESLLLALVLAALWVLLVPEWGAARRGAVAGLLLGLATLGRPTVLLTAPFAWLALRRGAPAPRAGFAGRGVLLCGLVWLLVLVPVVARNARLGAGLAITTNGGVNFYAGNAPGANGRFHEPPGVHFFTSPVFEQASSAGPLPPAVAARALEVRAVAGTDAAAESRAWTARAAAWIRAHPRDWLWLEMRKLWLLLQAREVAQIESYEFQRRRLPALWPFGIDFTVLWPLVALGLWRAARERRAGTGIVAGFAAALLAPCVVFFVTSRYRTNAVPELAVLGGFGAATLWGWVARREHRRVVQALAVLLPLAVLTRVGGSPPRGAGAWEKAQMAERLYALGDLPGAIRWQEQAARELPERFELQLNLALYWSERDQPGDLQRAEALLRDVVRRQPRRAVAHFDLGVVLAQQGQIEAARAAWAEALRLDPGFQPARARLLQSDSTPR